MGKTLINFLMDLDWLSLHIRPTLDSHQTHISPDETEPAARSRPVSLGCRTLDPHQTHSGLHTPTAVGAHGRARGN